MAKKSLQLWVLVNSHGSRTEELRSLSKQLNKVIIMEIKLGMKFRTLLAKLLVTLVLIQVSTIAVAHKANNGRLDSMEARMLRIEQTTNSEALIKLSQRISAMQSEIQQLRGENEQLAHQLNTLKTRQREQFLDIDRRLQSSSSSSSPGMIDNGTINNGSITNGSVTNGAVTTDGVLISNSAGDQSTESSTSTNQQIATINTATASNEAVEDYKNAFTLLKQGKYDESIAAFNGFLQTHSQSKYAANAQYWLAEANYVSQRYPQAQAEFSKVIEQYPASSKVADAKLKLGFTYYELGQYEQSRVELTRLRAQFPNSSVASLAQQRLERMAREGH
jgi:tol-pal system protein YbgF